MKLTMGILIFGLTIGTAWSQSPNVINTTRGQLNTVQQTNTANSNAALAATQGQSGTSTSAGSSSSASGGQGSASASKKPVTVTPAKTPTPKNTTAAKAAKPAPAKPAEEKTAVAVEDKKTPPEPKKEAKEINTAGKRDPFFSPVVAHTPQGTGCLAGGKRCLAIDQIALTGIVKSDTGMIAVVVNALNKAYFLRENDPVFNGYVVRITGDSITFKETIEDKLGKPFTREVTKKIFTPAV